MNIENFKVWDYIRVLKTELEKIGEYIFREVGLTEIQAIALMQLKMGDACTISRLAESLDTNQGNFSVVCKKMEQTGLITRKRNPDDERVVTIELTELGREKTEQFHDKLEELFKKAELSDQQRDTLAAGYIEAVALFKKINSNMEGKK